MKLIDDEIAKYERQAREAHADADETRDGFRRDFARQCEAKARQWRELRDSLPVGVPDRDAIHLAFEHKLREVNLPWYGERKGDWRNLHREEIADVVVELFRAAAPTVKAEQVQCEECGGNGAGGYHEDDCSKAPSLPAAGSAGKYGSVLRPFFAMMEAELHANSGKGDRQGWLAMSAEQCMLEIYYHAAKLQKAVKKNDMQGVREYSADVANMSMMMADIVGWPDIVNAELSAQQSAHVSVLREFVRFLLGEAMRDGVFFDSRHPNHRGIYWWRKELRALLNGGEV
jgi:hypothetical protein